MILMVWVRCALFKAKMLVSSSVVIQQNDNSITRSGSGLLLLGSNYGFGLSVVPNKEKMFSVFPYNHRY